MLLAITLLTGLFLLSQPLRSAQLLAGALAASLICGTYAGLAIYARQSGWHYPFDGGATFGFFPNRNHAASFLVVGSILSMGLLAVVLREGRWIASLLAAAVLTICVVGLVFFSSSRGGIVFLVAGTFIWVAGLGEEYRHPRLLVSVGALAVAAGMLLLASGSEVRDRLLGLEKSPVAETALPDRRPENAGGDAVHNLSTDLRLKIYQDTARLIRDFPLTGQGLGTFAMTFPQYRHLSLTTAPAIHPESDWLLLVADAGVPAALCLLLLVTLAAGRLRGGREHRYWPLRWGCAAAVAAALLHGLVDVPIHRVPLGWWLLTIACIALQGARVAAGSRSRVQHALFVGGGVAALVFGGALVRAQWFGGRPLPPFATDGVQERIFQTFQRKDVDGARRMAAKNMREHPLYDPGYFQFGAILFNYADIDPEVDAAFKAQRLINPVAANIPFQQGQMWLNIDPQRTAALWLEALARQERILAATGLPPAGALSYYESLVRYGSTQPDVQMALWAATRHNPGEALAWLENANVRLVHDQLPSIEADDAFIQRLDAGKRRRFLQVWFTRGDRQALLRFLDDHPGWAEESWPVRVRLMADAQQFEKAVREVVRREGISLGLPDPASASPPGESAGGIGTGESADPAAKFAAYWREGNSVAARRVIDEAVATEQGARAAELWRLKAALAAQAGDWQATWQSLEQFVHLTHPDDL